MHIGEQEDPVAVKVKGLKAHSRAWNWKVEETRDQCPKTTEKTRDLPNMGQAIFSFAFFVLSRLPAYWLVPPSFRLGLPASVCWLICQSSSDMRKTFLICQAVLTNWHITVYTHHNHAYPQESSETLKHSNNFHRIGKISNLQWSKKGRWWCGTEIHAQLSGGVHGCRHILCQFSYDLLDPRMPVRVAVHIACDPVITLPENYSKFLPWRNTSACTLKNWCWNKNGKQTTYSP